MTTQQIIDQFFIQESQVEPNGRRKGSVLLAIIVITTLITTFQVD